MSELPSFQADLPHCHLPMIFSAFSDRGGGAEQLHRVPGLSDTGSQQRGQWYILDSSFNHFCSKFFFYFQTACNVQNSFIINCVLAGFSECSLSTHITHVFLSVFLDVLWPVGKFTNINTRMFTALHCNNKKEVMTLFPFAFYFSLFCLLALL